MNTRDRKWKWRPESLQIANKVNESLMPIMEKAIKMGLSVDAFSYIVLSEVSDMINYFVIDKRDEMENGDKNGNNRK